MKTLLLKILMAIMLVGTIAGCASAPMNGTSDWSIAPGPAGNNYGGD